MAFDKKAYLKEYYRKNLAKAKADRAAWYQKNKDKVKACSAAYRSENPEQARAWRKANPDKIRRHNANYFARHSEKHQARTRAYVEAHPEVRKRISATYRAGHPDVARRGHSKYRALKKGATLGDTVLISAWEKRWRRKKRVECYWCKDVLPGKDCHQDHIVALSRGGTHSIENLCIACPRCNLSKQAKSPSEWSSSLAQPVMIFENVDHEARRAA